jgi:hypothetical protein
MLPKIIGQTGVRFLVLAYGTGEDEESEGYVVHIANRRISGRNKIFSILKHGYWELPTGSPEEAEALRMFKENQLRVGAMAIFVK